MIPYPTKNKGIYTANFACTGSQIDSNRICAIVSLPYISENESYNITVSSCVLLGIDNIDVSKISIDGKYVTHVRLMIAYSGTVRDSYAITIGLTISYP